MHVKIGRFLLQSLDLVLETLIPSVELESLDIVKDFGLQITELLINFTLLVMNIMKAVVNSSISFDSDVEKCNSENKGPAQIKVELDHAVNKHNWGCNKT